MLRSLLVVSILLLAGFAAASARAQDDGKKKPNPEFVPPAPKEIAPPLPPTYFVQPYYPRTDTRDVWQNYGLNSGGRMVPRVINTPYGYYYSRDLQPYPWAGTRPRAFVP